MLIDMPISSDPSGQSSERIDRPSVYALLVENSTFPKFSVPVDHCFSP